MSETITFETYWVGGKGAFKRAMNLATAVEEALHTFAYATMPGAGGGEGPGQIYGHLGSPYVGTGNLRQALEQMATQITNMGRKTGCTTLTAAPYPRAPLRPLPRCSAPQPELDS